MSATSDLERSCGEVCLTEQLQENSLFTVLCHPAQKKSPTATAKKQTADKSKRSKTVSAHKRCRSVSFFFSSACFSLFSLGSFFSSAFSWCNASEKDEAGIRGERAQWIPALHALANQESANAGREPRESLDRLHAASTAALSTGRGEDLCVCVCLHR